MNNESIPHAKELLGDASTQVLINQLLLAVVLREGGRIAMSATELDGTGDHMLNLKLDPDNRWIILTTEKKQ